jgi:iron complex outermembrane receptor protein
MTRATRHPTRHPLALGVLLALAASPVFAQSTPADDKATAKPKQLDTLVITGTRVSDRTLAESLSPIDVISPQELQSTGTTELATALSRVLPSLNFPRPAITDGTDAVRPAQVRGLSPDQVLVLVNGKRYHSTALINLNGSQGRGSSPADLNSIPIASIERVEVLRDGASALYGSDAIAGVINIVLKGGAKGGSAQLSGGQYSAGDGAQWLLGGDIGLGLGDRGWLRFAGQGGHADQTDRARPYTGAPGVIPYGRVVQRFGDPEVAQGQVSFNGQFKPADGIEFYGFGIASNRDVLSNGFFRAAGDSRNDPSIYPDGFLPKIRNLVQDRSMVLGLRGETAGGWHIDLSYNYGYNRVGFHVEDSLNRSLGPTSQTNFNSGALEVTQNVLNADFNKPYDVGFSKYPLNVAWGLEWRGDKFNESPGEPASYAFGTFANIPGAQVFPGFTPGDSGHYSRSSFASYLDLETDFTDRFSMGVAARNENFSDFGSTLSGKVSARFAFTDRFALRGTVANGFRAPSLQQQFFQSTATNFIGGVPFEVRTFAVTNPVGIALGAEPLKPEKSTSYSLGVVWQPMDDMSLTVDAYQVTINDRIILSENLTGSAVQTFLESQGIFGTTGGRYFTNAVDTRTRGVDIIGTYGFGLVGGQMDLTLGYNYNDTTILSIAPNPPELSQNGLNLERIGRVEIGRITKGAPKDKFTAAGVWTRGAWRLQSTLTRWGEFTVYNSNPSLDQTFGSQWTLDVAGTWTLDRWSFTLGSDNLFNTYPDEVLYANSNGGQFPYSSISPFGFNGAYVYGRIGYTW